RPQAYCKEVNERPLKKRLAQPPPRTIRLLAHFTGLTVPQGFVFSPFPGAAAFSGVPGSPRHIRAGDFGAKAARKSVCWCAAEPQQREVAKRGAIAPLGYRMRGLFRWSSKWWPGVIPLTVFWAIAAWNNTAPLEADLAARSGAALKNITLDKTRIAVAGRDVTLGAESFSVAGRQGAVASVDAVPGVRLVNDETRLVPEARPFVWSAERDVVRVTLSGSAPLPAVKGRLVEAAKAALGNVEVADQMGLARGAPPRFENAAVLLLDQIAKLKDGKITISDAKVQLTGMARDLGGR